MMNESPNAPLTAVEEIIRTFRGSKEQITQSTLHVQFENRSDCSNALHLINMLKGWSCDELAGAKNAVRVRTK